jgi:hypothetical protein
MFAERGDNPFAQADASVLQRDPEQTQCSRAHMGRIFQLFG